MMENETPKDGVSLVRWGGGMKGEERQNLEGTVWCDGRYTLGESMKTPCTTICGCKA
jgi:hypothetical protein